MLEGKPLSKFTRRLMFTIQSNAAFRHRTDFLETSLGDVGAATEKVRCETRQGSYKTHRQQWGVRRPVKKLFEQFAQQFCNLGLGFLLFLQGCRKLRVSPLYDLRFVR